MNKETNYEVIIPIISIWLVLNFVGCISGCDSRMQVKMHCEKPMRNIEYFLPGQLVGCWLGDTK